MKAESTPQHSKLDSILSQLEMKVVGQSQIIRYCLTAFLAEGHILIEGVPGLGKTTLAKSLSEIFSGKFSRIQMTSDLMPSDILGYFKPTGQGLQLEFQKGPIFTHVLLADEFNRTTPKTQSALLEAMAETQVTIEGVTEYLEKPFFVIATQNPVSSHGVFSLTESELDRFMFKLTLSHPSELDESSIYKNFSSLHTHKNARMSTPLVLSIPEMRELQSEVHTVFIHEDVLKYIQTIIQKTRLHPQVQVGASIRAGLLFIQALKAFAFISKKEYVTPEMVRELAPLVLAHRLVLTGYEIHYENSLEVIKNILDEVPSPQ